MKTLQKTKLGVKRLNTYLKDFISTARIVKIKNNKMIIILNQEYDKKIMKKLDKIKNDYYYSFYLDSFESEYTISLGGK
tara:strand:+ start:2448 stop:2684 length:237 start_codon:yes stop_codon:yes gene_type:complete